DESVLALQVFYTLPVEMDRINHVVGLEDKFAMQKTLDFAGETVPVLHDDDIVLALGKQRAGEQEQEHNRRNAGGAGKRSICRLRGCFVPRRRKSRLSRA